MGKPTTAELRQALDRAITMRESGSDPDFVAKSLLNLHYRVLKLERTLDAAKRYLHSGQSATDHRLLLQAVHDAEAAGADPGSDDLPILGRGLAPDSDQGAKKR
jgi:hypothetical protein